MNVTWINIKYILKLDEWVCYASSHIKPKIYKEKEKVKTDERVGKLPYIGYHVSQAKAYPYHISILY